VVVVAEAVTQAVAVVEAVIRRVDFREAAAL
jgi:hypothetical protein